MRALQLNSIFKVPRTNIQLEEQKRVERERIENVRPYVDTSAPVSLNQMKDAAKSPSKRLFKAQELKARLAKHNLALAKRIFSIMEGPGLVSLLLDPENNKHLELHPGTINFNARLEEAQRIHRENMILASRLDAMQPFYKKSNLTGILTRRNKESKKKKKVDDDVILTQRSENARNRKEKGHPEKGSLSARKASGDQQHNPFKVLLEYTKVQNGKVIDIAVIKEPFQDRFVIFGLDVDIGKRYEMRLTSEEISSILDGDVLMTSSDNIEVWVVLLNKITLPSVEAFSKLPSGVFPATYEHESHVASKPPSSTNSSRSKLRGVGRTLQNNNQLDDSPTGDSSARTDSAVQCIEEPSTQSELCLERIPSLPKDAPDVVPGEENDLKNRTSAVCDNPAIANPANAESVLGDKLKNRKQSFKRAINSLLSVNNTKGSNGTSEGMSKMIPLAIPAFAKDTKFVANPPTDKQVKVNRSTIASSPRPRNPRPDPEKKVSTSHTAAPPVVAQRKTARRPAQSARHTIGYKPVPAKGKAVAPPVVSHVKDLSSSTVCECIATALSKVTRRMSRITYC